ncbi:Diacylglycerol kinase 3 [Capsicum annuum]|uniref:diacylglycerol kinase 7 isoform X2 n=1 Tax=Capsicum annuum TaxID=4072 RepID=UPI001FB0FED4|nr:diacylglycerol kinase 7 isoform X2 [Capsicum annuum]KAF3615109.1 Diacylglycerol kinase 3 [Capsicum annuum]
MGSPEQTTAAAGKSPSSSSSSSSVTIWRCTGTTIHKEDLRKRITIPEYLRVAMREAIGNKDVDSAMRHYEMANADGVEIVKASESPIVVFINAKSGGRHGPELKARLQDLMGEEQVFDLSAVKPNEFVQYGLSCLEKFAALGDTCAKETREKIRIVAAGGDGTVGWVLGCLGELKRQNRDPVPPTGIIPLGTGNDLSRSFGWGGSFPFNWRTATKRILDRVANGPVCHLDSWNLVISMPSGEALETPHSLKPSDCASLDQELEIDGELPEKLSYYQGVFYNYFSIGMDAQVAYGFHHLRNEKPYLAQGPLSNKLIYSGYSCKQGWFFAPCSSDPGLRGLNNILRLYVKKVNSSKWEQVPVPSSVRSIVTLNLPSYGSGRNPWGNLKPEYLEKRGFVEAHADDGYVEIFGLKHGWHASMVMAELISAKHIAQASAIRFELRGGEWKEAYMQVDGEPWKQPINKEFSTFVEIKRVPFQSSMVHGE